MSESVEAVRVLIVDDQELFRRGLAMLLDAESDISVVGEARGVEDALEQIGTLSPEVVLIDVELFDGSGIEACRTITDSTSATRVIMLTVSDEEAHLYESVKSGASGYLLKSATTQEVAHAIRLVAEGQSLISPSMAAKLLGQFKTMSRGDGNSDPGPRLTKREIEVLKLVAKGLNNRDVALELFISENTVKNHVRNILEKLQLHSRMEAVMYAVREKILEIS
jgi:two-component system NarL family response regulator